MATAEDRYVITIDAANAIKNTDTLLKQVQKAYGGIARFIGVISNAKSGIDTYTVEVTRATAAVGKMAVAQDKLNKSIGAARQVSKVAYKAGGKGVYDALGVTGKKGTTWMTKGRGIKGNLLDFTTKDFLMAGGRARGRLGMRNPMADLLGSVVPPDIPEDTGLGEFSYINRNKPRRRVGSAGLTPGITRNAPLFPPKYTNYKPLPKSAFDIDWVKPGDKRFIPNKPKQQMPDFQRNIMRLNKGFFMLQMSTLGVAFSFMSLTNSITGIFQSLADIGGVMKNRALGKAFGGVDVAGSMGVSGGDLVKGWESFTGITSMIQTAMASIAALTLSPEVMAAVKSMFTELSVALSDPKIVQAMQQLVLAAVDFVKAVIPILPALATLVTWLGETGLLKVLVGVALSAGFLLPIMSLVGGAFQAVMFAITVLSPALTAIAGILGVSVVTVIAAVILVVTFLVNLMAEWGKSGNYLVDIFNALIDTIGQVWSVVKWLIDMLLGWIPGVKDATSWVGGGINGAKDWLNTSFGGGNSEYAYDTSTHKYVTNNYNFNGTYDDPSALVRKTSAAKSSSV